MQKSKKEYLRKYFEELGFSPKTIYKFIDHQITDKNLWELLGVSKTYLSNLKDNPPPKLQDFVKKKIIKINFLIENEINIPKESSDFSIWIKKNIYEIIRISKDRVEPQEGDLEFVDTKSIELNDINHDLFNQMIKTIHSGNSYEVFNKSFIAELEALKNECWQIVSSLELIRFDSNLLMLECKNPECIDDAYFDNFGSLMPPSEIIERGLAYQTIFALSAILERYYDYFNLFFDSKKQEKKYEFFKKNMRYLSEKTGRPVNKYEKFLRINDCLWSLRNICIHNNGDLSIKKDIFKIEEIKKDLEKDCDHTLKVFQVDRFKSIFNDLEEFAFYSTDKFVTDSLEDIYNIKKCPDCESLMLLTSSGDKDSISLFSKIRFTWDCSACKKSEEASKSDVLEGLKKIAKEFGHFQYNYIYKIYIPLETYMFFIDNVKGLINHSTNLLKIRASQANLRL
jgi:hypothetical protein